MRIDPESKGLNGLSTLILFIILNVAYLVTCLPLVTIGMATSALFEVTLRYADEERGDLVKGYVIALRTNAWRGTVVLLAFGLPAVMLAFSGAFWLSMSSILSAVLGLLCLLATCYLLAAMLYGFALVGRYEAPLRQAVRNALLLPMAEPLRTLGLLLLPLVGVCVLYVAPVSVVLVGTIGFSLGAYTSAFVLHSVFRRQQAGPVGREPVSPYSGQ